MANGGDINLEFIPETEFKSLAPEHREWLLYKSVRSLSFTCHGRPRDCDKKYVRVKHIVYMALFMLGVMVGLGVIQTQIILPYLVKAAIAAM